MHAMIPAFPRLREGRITGAAVLVPLPAGSAA